MGGSRLKLESLRSIPHLRPRTTVVQAVARIRSALSFATHEFFQHRGFVYVHTPLVTTSDCEGAGEVFQITTLLGEAELPAPTETELSKAKSHVAEQVSHVAAVKAGIKGGEATRQDLEVVVASMREAQGEEAELRERLSRVGGLPRTETGSIDYSKDFFAKKTFLTVSGQLEAEIMLVPCPVCTPSALASELRRVIHRAIWLNSG